MSEESTELKVSESTYERLRMLKAEFSAKEGKPLGWDEFCAQLIETEHRRKALFSWLYTVGVFLVVSLILLLPFGLGGGTAAIGIIVFYLIFAAGVAGFTTYVLTPWTLRKLKPFDDAPSFLKEALARLTKKAGLKEEPRLRLMETPEINAMTYSGVGRHYICITQGLMDAYQGGKISPEELEAILAHEIGHIKNADSFKTGLMLSWASILNAGGSIYFWLGRFSGRVAEIFEGGSVGGAVVGLMAFSCVMAGWVAQLMAKLAEIPGLHLMRQQEFAADAIAAELAGPGHMSRALAKLAQLNQELLEKELLSLPYADRWQVQPAHLSWVDRLYATHPPTEARQAILDAVEQYL